MDDELLDLVNDKDNIIGTINRKNYKDLVSQNLGYIRASELFIINDKDEVWVPIRTASKTIAPNGYDYSAAGHVASGEDYVSTIIRETEEEVNIKLNSGDLELIAKIKSNDTKYFRSIFVLRDNKTPEYNKDDFVSAEWLEPEELLSRIKAGHPAKSSLAETIPVLQSYLNSKK